MKAVVDGNLLSFPITMTKQRQGFTASKVLLWLLPGIYIAVLLLLDATIQRGLITPPFVVAGLVVMALVLKPSQMIPWAVIYTLIACFIFLDPRAYEVFSGYPFSQQSIPPLLRVASSILIGIGTGYLCVVLNSMRKSQQDLTEVMSKIPCPVVVSDKKGRILYWNKSVEVLLPVLRDVKEKNSKSLSFFDLLSPRESQGKTISSYLQRLENRKARAPLDLSANGSPIRGETQLMQWSGQDVLLTILKDGDGSPDGDKAHSFL